jgi:hypothetical protein
MFGITKSVLGQNWKVSHAKPKIFHRVSPVPTQKKFPDQVCEAHGGLSHCDRLRGPKPIRLTGCGPTVSWVYQQQLHMHMTLRNSCRLRLEITTAKRVCVEEQNE